jgi:hypothetical protein
MHLVTGKLAMELIQQVIAIHILTTLSIYLSRSQKLVYSGHTLRNYIAGDRGRNGHIC